MTIVDPDVLAARVDAPMAEIEICVPEDLVYLRGHFPDVPIVPGIVQIKWALLFARTHLGIDGAVRGVEALKYQHVMQPGTRAILALKSVPAAGKVYFSYGASDVRYSSGRLLLRKRPVRAG